MFFFIETFPNFNTRFINEHLIRLKHLNICGVQSKKKSLDAILFELKPNLVTLNKTGLKNNQKLSLTSYKYFN